MTPSIYTHKRLFIQTLLLSLILVFSSMSLSAADFSTNVQPKNIAVNNLAGVSAVLDVLSPEPSTGNLTTIEASGIWRNGCVPVLDSVVFDNSGQEVGMVLITAIAEKANQTCGQVETAWNFPIDVEFELPGYYMVNLLIVSEQSGTTELITTKSVVVAGHVSFTPQVPQLDEEFSLSVTGIHGDACVPEYVSHDIVDGKIIVEIMSLEHVCGQVLTLWEVDVNIGALESGEYEVEIYKSYEYKGVPNERTLYKTEALSIGVRASQINNYFVYLPSITSNQSALQQ